jgi:putative membrane protein
MYDHDGHDWGWGTWLGMGLMMTALMVAVVAAVVLLVRAVIGSQQPTSLPRGSDGLSPRERDALRVLDERLARGDIDLRDYRARRDLLGHQP